MQKVVLGVVLSLLALTLFSLIDIISSPPEQKEAASLTPSDGAASTKPTPPARPKAPLSLSAKKRAFIEKILPAVQRVKQKLDAEYAKALQLSETDPLTQEEQGWLESKMDEYNVKGMPCLLRRMRTHPTSLVIAQAALETGWGTSRFFKEANNVFGIWSYNENEPRIAASETRGEKTIYVKKYASLDDSIEGYFKMISDGYAYSEFRIGRESTDNPFELLKYLRRYSELREEYVARLYYVLRANRLYRLDSRSYAPPPLASIVPEYVAKKRQQKAQQERMVALCEIKTPLPPDQSRPVECD